MASDLDIIRDRRISDILSQFTAHPASTKLSVWIASLDDNGRWPDSEVNYTSGCSAQRANWPAQVHWRRIDIMAAEWYKTTHSNHPTNKHNFDPSQLLATTLKAAEWWFNNDFSEINCLDGGGGKNCPCGTPGLWNTNWYSNVILIPRLVASACMLLKEALSHDQLSNFKRITSRAYAVFHRKEKPHYLDGANVLDIASIGIDQALFSNDPSLLSEAYGNIHKEMVIQNKPLSDGIRADGSFSQHRGLIYNGNYGKDFLNQVLRLEIAAAGTPFSAPPDVVKAIETLIDGDRWMIYRNTKTNVLHWDFSVLGRFISFPVADNQATASIKIDLDQVLDLGNLWKSRPLISMVESLKYDKGMSANAGDLLGNRMFFANDYMVQRGEKYITTLQMFSSRTCNSECLNKQNPYGFHLSNGCLYTYIDGSEYEDIAAALDWDIIAGTTVDYKATNLSCANVKHRGRHAFVGGVSDGSIGTAVMQYTNPITMSLTWQKAWFFLKEDVQHVVVSALSTTGKAPVYSVLDQRRRTSDVYLNGEPIIPGIYNLDGIRTLWHGSVGYVFDNPSLGAGYQLEIRYGKRSGKWSDIGTSKQPAFEVDMFAAHIVHPSDAIKAPISYSVFPGVDLQELLEKSRRLNIRTLIHDENITAVHDTLNKTLMASFWAKVGGQLVVDQDITLQVDGNATVMFHQDSRLVVVSDPSQQLKMLYLRLFINGETYEKPFQLPVGGEAGSSVSHVFS